MNEERRDAEDAVVLAFPTSPSFRESVRPEPTTIRRAIGEVLREERHDQGRTLADVAGDAAVSLPYLSEVERGRKDVSSDVLEAITEALMLEPAVILERAARRLRLGSGTGPQMRLSVGGGPQDMVDDSIDTRCFSPQDQGPVGVGMYLVGGPVEVSSQYQLGFLSYERQFGGLERKVA